MNEKKWKSQIVRCGFIFVLTIAIVLSVGLFQDLQLDFREDGAETINVVSERILVPGGQSVGIRMDVKGVLVVGLEEIESEDGIISPGYLAGLQIGDIIVSINGTPVYYASDVERIINETKNELNIVVLRKNEELKFKLTPVEVYGTESYKIGVWVKERIAGIGTLSFYDPQTNMYAALGHGIYESQTNTLLEAGNGELLHTEVKSIREGSAGKPGEIRGIFYGEDAAMGQVKLNSQYGVFSNGIDFSGFGEVEPVIMASQDQIEEGPAQIRTTIQGSKIETFDIIIDKVNKQKSAGSKGIELTVTDDRLLSYSGGIVQGMSGSPIIQNGRLVGAVTHVFVNNPTKGYGIFAEWMVEECNRAEKLS
jgi:stage IV sporulation protein B